MEHKFELGDTVFYPIFDFNGFKEIKSGTISSAHFQRDGIHYHINEAMVNLREKTLSPTIEEAEKMAVNMAIADIKARYEKIKLLCEKHNMVLKEKTANEIKSGSMVETP